MENKAIRLTLTQVEILTILGNLILALKHPDNEGPSSYMARHVATELAEILIKSKFDIPEEVLREWKKELPML